MKRKRTIRDNNNNEEDAVERLIYNGVPGSISKPTLNSSQLQPIGEDGELVLSCQGEQDTSMEIMNCSQDMDNSNPNLSLASTYLPSGLLDSSGCSNGVVVSNASVILNTGDITLTNVSLNDSSMTSDMGNTTAVLSYNTRASSSSSVKNLNNFNSNSNNNSNDNNNHNAPITRTALKKRKVIQEEERKQQQQQQQQQQNISFSSPMKIRNKAQQLQDSASKVLVQLKNSPVAMK